MCEKRSRKKHLFTNFSFLLDKSERNKRRYIHDFDKIVCTAAEENNKIAPALSYTNRKL